MTAPFARFLTIGVAATALMAGSALAQDQSDWPDSITVGTASQGGTYFIYGSGWANLVQEMTGVNASAEVTGGPVQNATLVQTGDLDFAMVTMGPAYEAWIGESPLAPGLPHDQMRAMFPMYQTPFQCVALAESGIDSMSQLDGMTVGVGPAGGTPGTYWPRFFETLGLDVDTRNGGASDLATQLQDGLIDVFCFAAGIPISAFSQVEAQVNANIFSFNEEERQTILEAYPSVAAFTVPANTYQSIEAEDQTVAMWNFAITHADMSESFVYEIMSVVLENHDRMVEIHRAAQHTVPENYVHNSFLPFHAGAVRWYEENGIDIPDDLEG
ncbi:MAG: TAXI family TRAP transporter solute-binding subunit [Alphaproteobacteria bacterium]|jgi:TRAP transporter TAXI family solute receptor|nr:TAXI family TRAP transporter solute-binding subunit [Alphaproteobacteria bacterium]